MAAPAFRDIEQRVNRAVLGRLCNAQAVVFGREVPVIFDRPYAAPFDQQFDSAEPECVGASADLASLARDSLLTIDGASFRVIRAEPDGTGLTRLVLGAEG